MRMHAAMLLLAAVTYSATAALVLATTAKEPLVAASDSNGLRPFFLFRQFMNMISNTLI